MFDIDFIRSPCKLSRTVVYRYRSGDLLPEFKGSLKHIAQVENALVGICDPRDPDRFGASGLFVTLMVCDWSLAKPKLSLEEADLNLKYLADGEGGYTAHLVKLDRTTRDSRHWADVEKACLVIDDPVVTDETIVPILRFLDATTPLLDQPNLVDQPGFVDSFNELFEGPSINLADVKHLYIERVLTCTDMASQRFDTSLYELQTSLESGGKTPYWHLERLVGGKSRDHVDFVTTLQSKVMERGQAVEEVIYEIFRLTRRLLGNAGKAQARATEMHRPAASSEKASLADLVLWSAVLLAWTNRLTKALKYRPDGFARGPDVVFYTVDQLCRDFVITLGRKHAGQDPLDGHWAAITRCLVGVEFDQRDRYANAKAELLQNLSARRANMPRDRDPVWLERFMQRAYDVVTRAELRKEWRKENSARSRNEAAD